MIGRFPRFMFFSVLCSFFVIFMLCYEANVCFVLVDYSILFFFLTSFILLFDLNFQSNIINVIREIMYL